MRFLIGYTLVCMILLSILLLTSSSLLASTVSPVGWHWYNEKPFQKNKHKSKIQKPDVLYQEFLQLPSDQQLKILQTATTELKDKAVLTGNVADIANYKRAQDFWVSKATLFTVGWEKMLLENPNLDYSLKHSHENVLAPVMQQKTLQRENKAISIIAKQNGMMLFYRGNNKADLMFVKVCFDFSKQHHIALLLVSENTPSPAINAPTRFDFNDNHAKALGINYFPALLLVNPKTSSHQIIGYGFMSESELSRRFLNIEDNWRPDF